MFQSGSQINPSLGRTDYSAYTQGAAQGAQAIGQGIQQLGAGIGAAIKEYGAKKEEKQLTEATKETLKALAVKNPEMAKQFGVTDINDDKMWNAGIKAVGPKGAWQFAQGMQQQANAQEKSERVGSLTNFLVKNKGELPEDIASNLKGDEVVAARNAYEMIRGERAKSGLAEAQAATAGVEKVKEPTQFGVAYKAFKLENPDATPAEESAFISKYQAGGQPPKPFEDESTKQRAQVMANMFKADISKGDSARTMLSNYSKVKDLLKGGVKTGAFEESKLKAVSFLKSLGVDVDQTKLANAETAKALMGSSLIEWFDRTKGSISNSENSLFQSFGPEFAKSEQGNKLLIEAAEERLKVDTDLSRIASSGYENGLSDAEIMKNRNKRIAEYDKKLESIKAVAESANPTASQGMPNPNDIQAEIARRKAAKVK